jgi:phosphate transport system substrate-binding protein
MNTPPPTKQRHKSPQNIIQAVVIGLVTLLCPALYAQAVRVHGAVTPKIVVESHLQDIVTKSGSQIELLGNGSDAGLLDLVENRADIALISVELEDLAKKVNTAHAGAVDLTKVKSVPLGYAKFVLIVSPNNPVKRLTNQQAIDILSGKITTWKDVGGPDATIQVVTLPEGNGARATFQSQLLKTARITEDAKVANSTIEVRSLVAHSSRAIGMVGATTVSDAVTVVGLDTDVQSPMSLVVKGEPAGSVKKVSDAIVETIR